MYFKAFSDQIESSLPPDKTCRVEYWVTQLLADADPDFLKQAIEKDQLGHALAQELDFFGQVQSQDLPKVTDYLIRQARNGSTLVTYAERLASNPTDRELRRYLVQPQREPAGI